MKRRISIMITLCLALTACGSKTETPEVTEITPLKQMIIDEYNARGVKPGMSIDEVKAAETLELQEDTRYAYITETGSIRYFKSVDTYEYDNRPCTVEYTFINGQLDYFEYDADISYTAGEYYDEGVGGFNAYSAKRIEFTDKFGLPTKVEDDTPIPTYTEFQFFRSTWTDGDDENYSCFVALHASQDASPSIYADSDYPMSDSLSITFYWDGK